MYYHLSRHIMPDLASPAELTGCTVAQAGAAQAWAAGPSAAGPGAAGPGCGGITRMGVGDFELRAVCCDLSLASGCTRLHWATFAPAHPVQIRPLPGRYSRS
jgi:hypothetical protein